MPEGSHGSEYLLRSLTCFPQKIIIYTNANNFKVLLFKEWVCENYFYCEPNPEQNENWDYWKTNIVIDSFT